MRYISDPRGLYHVFYQCNLNSTLPPWAPGQEGTRQFYAPPNKYKLAALVRPTGVSETMLTMTHVQQYIKPAVVKTELCQRYSMQQGCMWLLGNSQAKESWWLYHCIIVPPFYPLVHLNRMSTKKRFFTTKKPSVLQLHVLYSEY